MGMMVSEIFPAGVGNWNAGMIGVTVYWTSTRARLNKGASGSGEGLPEIVPPPNVRHVVILLDPDPEVPMVELHTRTVAPVALWSAPIMSW